MAYPWQVARVANALEVLRLQGVEEADVQEIEKNLPDTITGSSSSHPQRSPKGG
jgi:hypothetical protein